MWRLLNTLSPATFAGGAVCDVAEAESAHTHTLPHASHNDRSLTGPPMIVQLELTFEWLR